MSTSREQRTPMPPATTTPQPPQQKADAPANTPYNARDAALRGATLAFGKPPARPQPPAKTYSGNNGALAAARQSSTPQPQPQLLRSQHSGASTTSHTSHTSNTTPLGLPARQSGRARSPSMLAATRAAARHTPAIGSPDKRRRSMVEPESANASADALPPSGTVSGIRGKLSAAGAASPSADAMPALPSRASRSSSQASEPTDATSIKPTTSLVKMFEQNKAQQAATSPAAARSPKPPPILLSKGGPPPLKSPQPIRNITVPFASPDQSQLDSPKQRPVSAGNISVNKPKPAPKPAKFLGDTQQKTPTASPHVSPKVPPKPTFTMATREIPVPTKNDSDDEDAAYMSAPETQVDSRARPLLPPPRRSTKKAPQDDGPTNNRTLELAEPPPRAAPLRRHSAADRSADSRPAKAAAAAGGRQLLPPPPPISSTYKRESFKKIEPHLTGDSLADAMVGAALAGSRVPTPSASKPSTPLPPPPRRSGGAHSHHHHHHHHHHIFHSRTPSPQKKPGRLMPTLRKEPSTSSSDGNSDDPLHKHKKKRHLRPKHPNKHAEGARKRWRDGITERERKRYEGVWAANRGLLLPAAAATNTTNTTTSARQSLDPYRAAQQSSSSLLSAASAAGDNAQQTDVGALVVRDIWSRSRLPPHVLEEVWNLVDGRGAGRLRRDEFVVGMWLIDQALKGRKLPVKVQESVWASVRSSVGVRVRIR